VTAASSIGRAVAAPDAIDFVARTATPWRLLPAKELGCGSSATAWHRLDRWARVGVFDRLHLEGLDRLGLAGRLQEDPVHVAGEGLVPVVLEVLLAQQQVLQGQVLGVLARQGWGGHRHSRSRSGGSSQRRIPSGPIVSHALWPVTHQPGASPSG
jgi:hypothetical protein